MINGSNASYTHLINLTMENERIHLSQAYYIVSLIEITERYDTPPALDETVMME